MSTDKRIQKDCGRILVVTDAIGPLTRERGKVGLRGGFEIFWFTGGNHEDLEGIHVYSVPTGRFPKLTWLKRALSLWKFIRKVKPDLIHVHWANQFFMNLILGRFKPLIVSVMGGDFLPERLEKFPRYVRWLISYLLDKAQVVTSKSDFMSSALVKRGVSETKIRRISWGVDLDCFKSGLSTEKLRRELEIPESSFIFFSPRFGKAIYNHFVIIEAFSLIQKRSEKDLYLLLPTARGDKTYIQELKEQSDSKGLKNQIMFLSEIPISQMPLFYNLADCVVSVPWSDGMPQSLYEAMACGCFPILGDLPQYKELVTDRVTGLYVPIGDSFKLSEGMDWVMRNPGIISHSLKINREKIQEFADMNQEAEKMVAIYHELIGSYPK